jgi:very-short-patch-repair endonuclease
MLISNIAKNKDLRRKLRKNLTEPERKIWNIVRNRQIKGCKFFRQFGVGNYILDFYCPEKKLAVELDGGHHFEEGEIKADKQRTEYLELIGIKVIRFQNIDVIKNIEGVYQRMLEVINSPNPSLEKRGKDR